MPKEWLNKLNKYVQDGYVRVATHPTLPLKIYNYTPKTEFEEKWDDITIKCRGLVLDNNGEIIVNSPPKFFNDFDKHAPKIEWGKAIITAKEDGYYISITQSSKYGFLITSRGSFDNKYVDAAKKLIGDIFINPDKTLFCELLQDFPGDESTIVTKHLIPEIKCWAIRDIDGKEYDISESPIKPVQKFTVKEAEDYLTKEVEGVVLQDPNTYERIKCKTDWFFNMHRIISNCTKKRVWEIIKDGGLVEELDIPDEFMQQMLDWEKEIRAEIEQMYMEAHSYAHIYESYTDKELGLEKPIPKPYDKMVWCIRKDKEQQCLDLIIREIGQSLKVVV